MRMRNDEMIHKTTDGVIWYQRPAMISGRNGKYGIGFDMKLAIGFDWRSSIWHLDHKASLMLALERAQGYRI